ncbi:MAG: hypothetical protein HN576_05460 [Bacteriovoracaceae bacterium]|jgi:hypothetical protein|nr:hypothetical protein [Bacteriovoracaceae bacterium]
MEVVKKTENYVIIKKRSGRYGVRSTAGKWINGAEKTNILVEAGLVKTAPVKDQEEPTAETKEAAAPQATTKASEEAPAEQ